MCEDLLTLRLAKYTIHIDTLATSQTPTTTCLQRKKGWIQSAVTRLLLLPLSAVRSSSTRFLLQTHSYRNVQAQRTNT